MKSPQDEADRLEVIRRLEALSPQAQPRWGRLTAAKMICHVADALRTAHGDLATRPPRSSAFTRFLLKPLFVSVLPMPRSLPTARELLSPTPSTFERDRQACADLVRRFPLALHSPHG